MAKLTKKEFISKANLIHGNIYDYYKVNYFTTKIKIDIICHKHGIFSQTPNNHLAGKECLKCSYIKRGVNKTKTNEEFITESNKIHENKYDYSLIDYKDARSKVKIICPEHGIFEQTPDKHFSGCGCPICKESKGETEIREYLIENDLNFIRQHTFNNCKHKRKLPFDFYILDYNICIEFNGRQHYEPINYFGGREALFEQRIKDDIKRKYCEFNNIPLLIIKHDENIIEKLKSFFKSFVD